MDILLSTDDNYVMPTGVLMMSVSENNKNVNYHILVGENFSEDKKDRLIQIAEQHKNGISFYQINAEFKDEFPFGKENQAHRVSYATYYRLLITELLPKDINKIIYLDGDMVVRGSLNSLWNTDISGYAVGVVYDMDEMKHCTSQRLPYPMDSGYFNAGVMLINFDYWRKHKCLERFISFAKSNWEILHFHDQDILNGVLYDEKKWLPITYNFQNGFIYKYNNKGYREELEAEIHRTMYNPLIVHFSSPDKPWLIESFHPYCTEWRHYWRMTKWGNDPLDGENAQSVKQKIRNYFVKRGWYIPGTHYYRDLYPWWKRFKL